MKLRHIDRGRVHRVRHDNLVGRKPYCDLRLKNPRASGRHAEFRWVDGAWQVRDLGSRNGSFADGRLIAGQQVLEVGMHLAFGDPHDVFEIVDTRPPTPSARRDDGLEIDATDGFLAIPDAAAWHYMIVDDGASNWYAETRGGARKPVEDGAQLMVAGRLWTVHIPAVAEPTWQVDRPRFSRSRARLTFTVSRDQETIGIALEQAGERQSWPSRVHHELLLRLAEERLRDERAGTLPAAEHGWLLGEVVRARLSRTLTGNALHQYIHRARNQFARAGVVGAADVIERRHGAGTMRIGFANLAIVSP